MWRRLGSLCALGSLALVGCGPLQKPMPPRPDAGSQKQIDESWDKALRPVDRLNRQQVLDVLVTTFAFETGVDRLAFRSEKEFAGGQVVMEIAYDRKKPGEDRFEVSVYDRDQKRVRHERYTRQDVESTYDYFYGKDAAPDANPDRNARWQFVMEFFPNAAAEERRPFAGR